MAVGGSGSTARHACGAGGGARLAATRGGTAGEEGVGGGGRCAVCCPCSPAALRQHPRGGGRGGVGTRKETGVTDRGPAPQPLVL